MSERGREDRLRFEDLEYIIEKAIFDTTTTIFADPKSAIPATEQIRNVTIFLIEIIKRWQSKGMTVERIYPLAMKAAERRLRKVMAGDLERLLGSEEETDEHNDKPKGVVGEEDQEAAEVHVSKVGSSREDDGDEGKRTSGGREGSDHGDASGVRDGSAGSTLHPTPKESGEPKSDLGSDVAPQEPPSPEKSHLPYGEAEVPTFEESGPPVEASPAPTSVGGGSLGIPRCPRCRGELLMGHCPRCS